VAAVLALPTAWMVYGEIVRRGAHLAAMPGPYPLYWLAGIAASLVVWAPLLVAASAREGALRVVAPPAFVLLFAVVHGTQSAFHAVWNVYLSIDGQLHADAFLPAILGTLPLARPLVVLHYALAVAVAAALVALARRVIAAPPGLARGTGLVGAAAAVGLGFAPASYRVHQASPPDTLYAHGLVALAKELSGVTDESPDRRVQRRSPEPLPALHARPSRPRNVVLVLQESLRADVGCVGYERACDRSNPWSNAVAPGRMPLRQMRANASTTAISISTIWSGIAPTAPRDLLHRAPLLWEYAAAAGYDTAYWTSQNLMFGNARVYVQDLPLTRGCVATHLDPAADLDFGAHDELVARRVAEEIGALREPFFAVVHFSNNHYPYVHEEALAPFSPWAFDKSPEKNDEFFRYYQNVAYRSDLAVAEALRAIRTAPSGERTVIVYTADHGESFREHWQMGHTSALYDEEVLVPTWIDAPAGTLSPEEEASIRGAEEQPVWHVDLGPTFLDLLGLWDAAETAPFRARMMGHPITRPERTVAPVPMTNCTGVWECNFRNWGLMQGLRKIEAREWDGSFHCFDLARDPGELVDLGERRCAPLPALAREAFHAMPNVTPPGRPIVDWGK
jgi:glucan phosphoethanolaminetransferase (alkaline phosphatase superfamily)